MAKFEITIVEEKIKTIVVDFEDDYQAEDFAQEIVERFDDGERDIFETFEGVEEIRDFYVDGIEELEE